VRDPRPRVQNCKQSSSRENTMDLSEWKGVPRPQSATLEGRYARLEPLDPKRHGAELFASAREPGGDERFRYLFEETPVELAELTAWLEKASASGDPLFFAVIDKRTGRAEGRQALMRIDPFSQTIFLRSVIVASNGSATISTNPRNGLPNDLDSRSRASSAITWSPKAATAIPLGLP
jgi:hypothetical protein